MGMLRTKLERAVELNLLSREFVKGLDFRESSITFSDRDNKLLIAMNYSEWLFGEADKLKVIVVDLDRSTIERFER